MKKLLVIVVIFLTITIFWLTRYQIYPVQSTNLSAYKLDRWTGKVTLYLVAVEILTQSQAKSGPKRAMKIEPIEKSKNPYLELVEPKKDSSTKEKD
jgi:hypothetical protein